MPYRLAIPQYSTDDIIADFRGDVNSFGKKSWYYAENIFWGWSYYNFFFTTSPTDARTASRRAVPVFLMLLLGAHQEVTSKKPAQRGAKQYARP